MVFLVLGNVKADELAVYNGDIETIKLDKVKVNRFNGSNPQGRTVYANFVIHCRVCERYLYAGYFDKREKFTPLDDRLPPIPFESKFGTEYISCIYCGQSIFRDNNLAGKIFYLTNKGWVPNDNQLPPFRNKLSK